MAQESRANLASILKTKQHRFCTIKHAPSRTVNQKFRGGLYMGLFKQLKRSAKKEQVHEIFDKRRIKNI